MRRLNHFFHCTMLITLFLVVPAVCSGQWTNWGQVNTNGFGDTNNFSAFSMIFYRNQLYVGTWNNATGCEVWRRDGSGTGDWTQIITDGFGSANNRGAHAMAVYNDCLYVGTANNANGFDVWAYDGLSWTQKASGGLGDSANTWVSAMIVHDGKLYLGTSWQASVFTYDGSTWTQINVNGFGDSDNQAVRSLAAYNGKVYAGVYNTGDHANLYRCDGPTTADWTLVASGGFGGNFVEFRSLAAYDGKLFIGGAGWSISCQVWEYDGTIFTRNDPGDAMKYDSARSMTVFLGKLYVGTGNDSGVPSGGQVWEYDGTAWGQVNDNGFGDTANEAVHSLTADGSSLFAGVANTAGAGGKVFASLQAPIVTTQAVTDIGTTTATGNGTITDLGYSNPTAHGVCWNTTGTPTTTDSHTDEGAAAATGPFTSSMTGLSAGTTYYVRAYATNTAGTAYGNEISFTTSPQAPTVTTQAVTGIGATTATGNGNITDLGAPNPTAHGVVWNTTGTPTTADNSTNEGVAGAIGAFTSNIAGLSPGTIYYVRAYATNTAGTAYGSDVSFITTPQLPVANEVSATVAYNSSNNPIALNITGGTPTSVAVASPASHGTATAGGTSITYTPTAGYSGSDSFTYTASNAGGTSAPATVTITVIDDSDGDGLPDWEEQGPDGNDPNYDGNGDGIPDWKQSNVSSFHTNTPNGEIHYISLAIPSDQRIEYVYVPRVFADPPPEGVSFPYGFFSFTLTGIPAGGTTTMTIYLDGPPPQTYYKYGKTPDNPQDHWYEFSYDGQTGAAVVGNTFVLHLIDGKRGDHDLEANGRIVDPGGPAEIEPHEGLYFPYLVSTGEEKTEIEIINIENYTSTSTISYYGENGDLIKTDTITLGPQGKATISSDNIPQNSASAIVSGDGDPLGYTRYVNTQGKRCAWPAGTSVQKFLSVPHTAVNAEWATALSFFNPGDESVEVTLVYESGASGTFTLNARSRRFLRLAEGESVVSISSTGYISGMEMFDSRISGGDAAALLLRECSLNALYVPSILHGSGEFTGIGLKSHYNGTVNVTGHSATGETEEISFGTQPLGTQTSQSRMAFNMSGILGDDNLWAKIFGEADFSTPVGTPLLHFQGLAVYGKEHTGKLGAVHMNALKFREGFIGIPSTASEITVALLNPGTAEATVAMTGFNASGEALADSTIKIAAGSTWTGAAGDLLNDGSIAGMTHLRIVSDVDLCGFETISTGDRTEMLPVMGRE